MLYNDYDLLRNFRNNIELNAVVSKYLSQSGDVIETTTKLKSAADELKKNQGSKKLRDDIALLIQKLGKELGKNREGIKIIHRLEISETEASETEGLIEEAKTMGAQIQAKAAANSDTQAEQTKLVGDITKVQNSVRSFRAKYLNKQIETANRIQLFTLLIAITMLLLVVGLSYLGLRISRQIQSAYETVALREKDLSLRTAELTEAKQETDAILKTVDEGMFIVRRTAGGYKIGNETSEAVSKILNNNNVAGSDLFITFSTFMPESLMSQVKDYLNLIFDPKTDESFITQLNPLEKVPLQIYRGETVFDTKIVDFRFKKIISEIGEISYLVSIRDMTAMLRLEHELAEQQKKSESQMSMLLSVLHVGPRLLQDFMEGVEIELQTIHSIIESPSVLENHGKNLEVIFRSAHSIKGNASLLDLKFLIQIVHEYEDDIQQIRQKDKVKWDDFLPISIGLTRVESVFGEFKDMIGRIMNFQSEMQGTQDSSIALIPKSTANLAERLAGEHGKSVVIDASGFHAVHIANRYAYILRDMIVQLTRNSIAHGIEPAEERLQRGKPATGQITLSTETTGGKQIVRYRDDGRGFQIEAIKAKAIANGLSTEAEIASWPPEKIVKLILEPGFSTATEATMDAGRGMGMDIVRKRIRSVDGDMRIGFQPGKYVEFTFELPGDEVA